MEVAVFVGWGGVFGSMPLGNVLKNTLNNAFWRPIYTELRVGGGVFGSMPLGNVLKNTLNNAFWRPIYTELRNHGISLVIISRDYVYQYLK